MSTYAHDDHGRLIGPLPDNPTEDEIAAAIAARDEQDAANLSVLRAAGRLFNKVPDPD